MRADHQQDCDRDLEDDTQFNIQSKQAVLGFFAQTLLPAASSSKSVAILAMVRLGIVRSNS